MGPDWQVRGPRSCEFTLFAPRLTLVAALQQHTDLLHPRPDSVSQLHPHAEAQPGDALQGPWWDAARRGRLQGFARPLPPTCQTDMFWDFISLRPETTHQVSFLFSDRGIPDGYRHMNGYGSHTFKLVNDKGEAVYCKFHFKTDQVYGGEALPPRACALTTTPRPLSTGHPQP